MIDAVTIDIAPAADLIALDLWEGEPPDLGDVRALKVEPMRWWLVDAAPRAVAVAAALGMRGALTPFGGGMVRATITGPGWRDLLSVSGVLDVADPAFASGKAASTVIHHVPVCIAVVREDCCEVFFPASYATTLQSLWRDATQGDSR